ncbi:MAG TPA: HDIG domain-containing protein [Deltaproteobacteria bacterium]|nr:HDIG domain-containing protein [Deltaproteobacteria bacterium]
MEAIPDRQWVSRLMSERGMPGHIVRHCRAVRMVAVAIACALREKGFGIDVRLVDRASLLHDICKADCLGGGDHALMGRQLLDRLGFPRIGDVVGQHVRLRSMEVCEAMVVNYADKRVMHDRVVSLERRFVDLMDRYGRDEQRVRGIQTHYMHTCEVERILVRASGIDPEWLESLNLVLGDHPLDGGRGLFRQNGAVEEDDHHVNLEGVDENDPV